jgi:hypothetical protein
MKFGASLNDYARVVIYDCYVFIVKATGVNVIILSTMVIYHNSMAIPPFNVIK